VTRHQYGISAPVSQTSFGEETSGSVAKCRLFSQASADDVVVFVDVVVVVDDDDDDDHFSFCRSK